MLIVYATSKSLLQNYGGIEVFSRIYLKMISKDLGPSPYNDSYLSMVLIGAEEHYGIDNEYYNDALNVAVYLMDNGQDINDDSYHGFTLLNFYVSISNYHMTEFLLKHGADPNIKVKGDSTHKFYDMDAMEIAKYKGYEDIIKLLSQYQQKQ